MDTSEQGWTPYDIYTTEILIQMVKEIKRKKRKQINVRLEPEKLPWPHPLHQRGLADENGNS